MIEKKDSKKSSTHDSVSNNSVTNNSVANNISEQIAGDEYPVKVTIKTLLDAGAHFGHQTERWCPKMLPYIYGARNGIHIINLDLTLKLWERARKFVVDKMAMGGNILFVGTKDQARDVVQREALRSGAFFVTSKWLGGTLSNFQTIKNSIERMKKMEEFLTAADVPDSKIQLHKKEKLQMGRELSKLHNTLGGIRSMKKPPDVLFVLDINKEAIAVSEARRLHIPVVAIVDTNTDPGRIDFPIPANDDASRTIKLLTMAVADAVIEGKKIFEARATKPEKTGDSTEDGNTVVSHGKDSLGTGSTLAASTA